MNNIKEQLERVQDILEQSRKMQAYKEECEYVDVVEDLLASINDVQNTIQEYFSDIVQYDETPIGAIRRSQLRTKLLDFARKKV